MHPDFQMELRKFFTGDLRFDTAAKILYSTDASMYQIEPLGVAIPKTQDDLHFVVELAAKYKTPILPRGSGSSLGGQAIGEALILDCSRYLDSIIQIDPDSQTATVEPGVILADLNRAVAQYGLMFGPDPASAERATMGGVIGNNATGAHSILYGMSADHLLSTDVILADGSLETWDENVKSKLSQTAMSIRENYAEEIIEHFPRTWRNSAGYRLNYLLPWSASKPPQWTGNEYPPHIFSSAFNLAHILAGSEGTLAVMRRATVNLVRKPKYTILGVLSYQNISKACNDVQRLLEFKPSAIELIPRMILQLARSVPAFEREMGWVAGDPAAVLVIEFSGDQLSALKTAVRRLGDVLVVAESPEDQGRIWNIRKMGLGILDSRPQAARPAAFIEDCAIPVEHLGEFVHEVEKILNENDTEAGIYAHASGGCLHIRPIINLQAGEGVRAMRSIAVQVSALALRLGGSMSSEHGDGIVAGEWIEKTYGAVITEAMQLLKRTADPENLLNPRKMFDAPPMDTHLRYGENYRSHAWASALHFNHERGLAGVIEQCNGQGVCRKTTGVMCPSFQSTRNEAFSTRGRANLLRALMSSNAGDMNIRYSELESATYSALDLCLACKGCTSECPSGVDMPKLKYEFMNEYYKTHWHPLRDYLFGYFHIVSKYLSPISPFSNLFMKMNWSSTLLSRFFGITRQRPFPVYNRNKAKPAANGKQGDHKRILFLSDVFSQYLEPQVAQAAFDILEFAGYEVLVLPIIGAGASLLSKGFVAAARVHAEKVLDAIKALDQGAGLRIVGCEPPEIYCFKHEYFSLLPERRAELEVITKNVWLLDEFLLRSGVLEDLRVVHLATTNESRMKNEKITFQPHCHQRAEGLAEDGLPSGASATVAMLRAFGFDVNMIDAGCCGMAGTFGYDTEHYALSMQIGELGVLPKVRMAETVVSTGSACRMQIKQGAGKDARHPLELVAQRISNSN
jgi:FAD/FMN-containing dehydrogenase/Fe-S oxidoreductase